MAKSKLEKFADIKTYPNVFYVSYEQGLKGYDGKGKWHKNYFKNENPVVLELGCGKGEYTVGLGQKYPAKNFIGVDIKGNRIWTGATTALEEQMRNIAFLRIRIDFLEAVFTPGEVSEIWITFPDPQPKKVKAKKRLTSPEFLAKYKNILKQDGILHLKTDSELLYQYTLEVIKENNYLLLDATADLYADEDEKYNEVKSIKTYYEKLFSSKGFKICYLKFKFA